MNFHFHFLLFTYVSGLFSMNSENVPWSDGFWFFLLSRYLTLAVAYFARPPVAELRMVENWVVRWKEREKKVYRDEIDKE